MNWKGCERKRYWPNLRHYLGICMEGLWKSAKILVRTVPTKIGTEHFTNTSQNCYCLIHIARPILMVFDLQLYVYTCICIGLRHGESGTNMVSSESIKTRRINV
jgi:hypothetical protein